jgi:scyllo-inosamine-4-phosphate amidinotransferase 1
MSLVNVHNEWDPLEEVIVGSVTGARVPLEGEDLYAVEFVDHVLRGSVPSGPFPDHVIEETTVELDLFCAELSKAGIAVRRPQGRDLEARITTPDWSTDAFYDYCPRDVLLAVGDTIIETPMVLRSRFLEPFAYKGLLLEYFASGARWLSAPKPRLADELYDATAPAGHRLRDFEPAFDAANVLRFGTDLLYLVSDSGNELGWQWLQRALGERYTVHPCRDLYASTHVDSTIVPLRPGLVLLNPARVNASNLPGFLRGWDQLWAPEMVDGGHVGVPYASTWIGMNLLVLRPGLVVVDRRQEALMRLLEGRGIDVLPLQLTHARTLGGSFHCTTLDVRRTGELETYR